MSHASSNDGALTRATAAGMRWTYISLAVSTVVQLVFVAVMSRLLQPQAFGVFAAAMAVVAFGRIFGQLGLGAAVVQRPEITESEISAAFTYSWIFAAAVGAVVALAAGPLARLVGEPSAQPVLAVLAASFVLSGLSAVPLADIRREFRFSRLALIEVLASVGGYLVIGVLSALFGLGIWSLVAATVTHSAIEALLAAKSTQFPKRMRWRWADVAPMVRFGGTLSVAGAVQQISVSIGTVGFAHLLGTAPLGQYNRAQAIANPLFTKVTAGFSKVLFPGFSRIQADRARLRRAYLSGTLIAGGLLGPLAAVLAATSTEIVGLLLGDGWSLAAQLFPLVLIILVLNLQTHFAGVALDACGRAGMKLGLEVAHLSVAVLGVVTFGRAGASQLLVVLAVSGLIRLLAYGLLVERVLGGGRGTLVVLARIVTISVGVYVVAAFGRGRVVGAWESTLWTPVVAIVVAGLLGTFVMAVLWWVGPLRSGRLELVRRLQLLTSRPRLVRVLVRLGGAS